MISSTHHRLAAGAVILSAGLTLAACGGGTEGGGEAEASPSAPAVEADPALQELLPEGVAEDGALTIGMNLEYPPNEFVGEDGSTPDGWAVAFAQAVAGRLGLEADIRNAGFDTIIPSVQSGEYEIGISSFTINEERMEVVDFVSYYTAGTSWAAAAGNPEGVDPENACGLAVGVQQGTVQVEDLEARSQECTDAGQPAIDIRVRGAQTEVNTDLVAGNIVAMLADSPIVGYAVVQTNNQVELIGETYDAAPYGVVVGQDSEGLDEAVQGAVQSLMDDGTYTAILEEWGVQDGAIETAEINPTVG
ncbi:ABC transporter substrate-binding protein [Allonocardiopsis opalescens]|nr:ABC transporter substrate-binding protein [Allonocardiopsis opalescens]